MTRRTFLAATGATLALGALAACGGGRGSGHADAEFVVYKLSGRGRRVSNAAKKHNANMRFLSLASVVRAHPGDTSKVVRLSISRLEWARLFGNHNVVADLRHVV